MAFDVVQKTNDNLTQRKKNYFSQIESTLPFFRQGELSFLKSNLFRKSSRRVKDFFEKPFATTQRGQLATCFARRFADGGRGNSIGTLDCSWTKSSAKLPSAKVNPCRTV
ncbi:hypothetical protein DTL21_19900 [Bremerella cremea]|uniref:Uncharacterized protein n=1 Tax=Blastopirellula marina TaxID=124 RepID=A0A2S8FJX4_9BACT|nr:hypothetical protein C5Y83_19880 [Blastopirellula marina]RCS45545.1 hypothetical protein DTL21_19900 [Bremerella cremea]